MLRSHYRFNNLIPIYTPTRKQTIGADTAYYIINELSRQTAKLPFKHSSAQLPDQREFGTKSYPLEINTIGNKIGSDSQALTKALTKLMVAIRH